MRRRSGAPLLALTLAGGLACVAAAPAVGQSRSAAVGAGGEVFSTKTGTYGELFPGVGLADPAYPALALDVTFPDQRRERLLVPGTEAIELEKSPSVLFEDQTGTLFLLWQTDKNGVHSWLNLIGYRDGEWTEAIEISGSPFGWKSSPQLAITRDTFQTREDGEVHHWTRTVAHLIWWEYGEVDPQVLYAPIIFLDGEYTGWNPVYHLDELELATGERPLEGVALDVARSPRIRAGQNGQSVTIGFVLAETGELVTVALELLPGEIGFLAGDVRAQIVDLGRQAPEAPRSVLGDKVRAQIVDLGRKLGFHPGFSTYLADQVAADVSASSPETPIVSLADDVRAQIVDLGAHMTENGFDRSGAFGKLQVLEVEGDPARKVSADAPPSLIRLLQASARPAPATTPDAETALFLSRDGKQAIVAWSSEHFVFYRETRGQEWSGILRLPLGGDLDLDRAWEMLERRVE